MKTKLFVGVLLASGIYLFTSGSDGVSQWFKAQSPQGQMDKMTEVINSHVNSQLTTIKQQLDQKYQQQNQQQFQQYQLTVEGLQQQIGQLNAQLTEQATTNDRQLADLQQHLLSQAATQPANAGVKAGVNAGVNAGDRAGVNAGVEIIPLSPDPLIASTLVSTPDPQINGQSNAAAGTTVDTASFMTVQQRRKALQGLSQRMALKALNAGL